MNSCFIIFLLIINQVQQTYQTWLEKLDPVSETYQDDSNESNEKYSRGHVSITATRLPPQPLVKRLASSPFPHLNHLLRRLPRDLITPPDYNEPVTPPDQNPAFFPFPSPPPSSVYDPVTIPNYDGPVTPPDYNIDPSLFPFPSFAVRPPTGSETDDGTIVSSDPPEPLHETEISTIKNGVSNLDNANFDGTNSPTSHSLKEFPQEVEEVSKVIGTDSMTSIPEDNEATTTSIMKSNDRDEETPVNGNPSTDSIMEGESLSTTQSTYSVQENSDRPAAILVGTGQEDGSTITSSGTVSVTGTQESDETFTLMSTSSSNTDREYDPSVLEITPRITQADRGTFIPYLAASTLPNRGSGETSTFEGTVVPHSAQDQFETMTTVFTGSQSGSSRPENEEETFTLEGTVVPHSAQDQFERMTTVFIGSQTVSSKPKDEEETFTLEGTVVPHSPQHQFEGVTTVFSGSKTISSEPEDEEETFTLEGTVVPHSPQDQFEGVTTVFSGSQTISTKPEDEEETFTLEGTVVPRSPQDQFEGVTTVFSGSQTISSEPEDEEETFTLEGTVVPHSPQDQFEGVTTVFSGSQTISTKPEDEKETFTLEGTVVPRSPQDQLESVTTVFSGSQTINSEPEDQEGTFKSSDRSPTISSQEMSLGIAPLDTMTEQKVDGTTSDYSVNWFDSTGKEQDMPTSSNLPWRSTNQYEDGTITSAATTLTSFVREYDAATTLASTPDVDLPNQGDTVSVFDGTSPSGLMETSLSMDTPYTASNSGNSPSVTAINDSTFMVDQEDKGMHGPNDTSSTTVSQRDTESSTFLDTLFSTDTQGFDETSVVSISSPATLMEQAEEATQSTDIPSSESTSGSNLSDALTSEDQEEPLFGDTTSNLWSGTHDETSMSSQGNLENKTGILDSTPLINSMEGGTATYPSSDSPSTITSRNQKESTTDLDEASLGLDAGTTVLVSTQSFSSMEQIERDSSSAYSPPNQNSGTRPSLRDTTFMFLNQENYETGTSTSSILTDSIQLDEITTQFGSTVPNSLLENKDETYWTSTTHDETETSMTEDTLPSTINTEAMTRKIFYF